MAAYILRQTRVNYHAAENVVRFQVAMLFVNDAVEETLTI